MAPGSMKTRLSKIQRKGFYPFPPVWRLRLKPWFFILGLFFLSPFIILAFLNESLSPLVGLIVLLLILFGVVLSRGSIIIIFKPELGEKLVYLHNLTHLFQEDMEPRRLIGELCKGLAELLECKRVYCFTLNTRKKRYEPFAWFDEEGDGLAESIPAYDKLLDYLLDREKPVYLHSPEDAHYFSGLTSSTREFWSKLGFVALVPIIRHNKLLGFLGFSEKEGKEGFLSLELRALDLLTVHLGLLLEKEHLKETLRRQVKELASAQEALSQVMTNPYHLDSVLEKAVESLKSIFPQARVVELCLWDERRQKMVVSKVKGNTGLYEGYEYELGEGLSGRLARDRHPILIRDTLKVKKGVLLEDETIGHFRSFIGVPLISSGRLIGSLEVDSDQPEAFDINDLRFLESIASRVAALIENTQTYQHRQREREALIGAYNIISTFLASGMENRQAISHIAQTISKVMGADACTVRIWQGEELVLNQCIGPSSIWEPLPWEKRLCEEGKPVRVNDLRKAGFGRDYRDMRSFMAVPLKAAERGRGWVVVWKREPYEFSDGEEEHLQAFAAQISALWNRMVLTQELELKAKELSAFYTLCHSLEKAETLGELAEEGLKAITEFLKNGKPVESFLALFTLEEKADSDEPCVSKTQAFPVFLADLIKTISPSCPIEVSKAEEMMRIIEKAGFENALTVPLEFAGKVWGMLALVSSRRLQEEKVQFLQAAARQIGAAAARIILHQGFEDVGWKFKEALSLVADGTYVVGRGGRIKEFSEKAQKITGFQAEAVLGKHCQEIYAPPSKPPLAIEALGHRKVIIAEKPQWIKTRDGQTIPVVEVAIPVVDENLSITEVVVAFWDLSRQEELKRMQELISVFLPHELRKPLAKISLKLDLFKECPECLEGEEREDSLEALRLLVEELKGLVDEAAVIARLESGRLELRSENVEVAGLVRKLVRQFEQGGTHKWELRVPPHPVYALADPHRTGLVLRNLLDNAVKYSPKNSLVTVEVGEEGDEIFISVKDRGMGIPAYYQSKIFEKFYRVDGRDSQQVDGLGLGLYLCKLLVEMQGGRIWVESKPQKGSKFTFTLPKASLINANA